MKLRFLFLFAFVLASFPLRAAILTLRTNGVGTVSPALGGQDLTIGKIYSISANPGKGYVFSNWSGSILTSTPKLSFIMQPNLILEANFVPNPFIPRAGRFAGVFFDTNNASTANSGFFALSLSRRGTYSGYILLSTNRYAFKGRFDVAGASTPVFHGGVPVSMALTLDVSTNGDGITGLVTNVGLPAVLSAGRAAFTSSTNSAIAFAGKYTLVIPGPNGTNNRSPAGAGFSTATVSKRGRLTLKGSTALGSAIKTSVSLDRNGEWPFFISLNRGTEMLLGWVTLADLPVSDLTGQLLWINRAQNTRAYYPAGFTNLVAVIGSRYSIPARKERILDLTNGVVTVRGGPLGAPLTNLFALRDDNRVIDEGISRLTLTFNRNNGLFRGHILPARLSQPLIFQGAVLQKARAGAGYFLTTNLSGSVVIADLGPPPGPLQAAFSLSTNNVVPGVPITFTASFSDPVATSYWNFGDGTFVTNAPTAIHSYATNGDYIVSLTGFNFTAPTGAAATNVVHILDTFTNSPPAQFVR